MTEKNKDRDIEAIAKIISLTRSGKLEWSVSDIGDLIDRFDNDTKLSTAFVCNYDDKFLRIFKRTYTAQVPPSFAAIAAFGNRDGETRTMRRSEVILEIVDENMNSLWQFPRESMLEDLLQVIRYRTSGADELITKLLSEP